MNHSLESRCKLVTDIYKISRDVMLAWFDAARSGDLKTMKRLYKNVTEANSSSSKNQQHPLVHATGEGTSYGFVGSTVLHWAAANGDVPMMKQLFDWGASPNAQNKGGSTPLHSACSNLRAESASLLLQRGANPDLSDCCNDTPMDILKNILRSEAVADDDEKQQSGKNNKVVSSTSSIARQINKMLQIQSLAMKMSGKKKHDKNNSNNSSAKSTWDVASMKKLVVGCGFFSREDECPKEREELEKVCEMALGHFTLQLDLAASSDSAFEKLKSEFDEKVQQRLIAAEKKKQNNKNNNSDDDDESAELEILQQKAKQTSDKGNQSFNNGDFKSAVQFYTAAISLAPHDATFYSNRAAAYLKMKVPKRALADAKTAASLRPEWAKPYHRWGCAALDLGLLSDAVAAFKLGLEKAPGDASLLSGMESVLAAVQEKRGAGASEGKHQHQDQEEEKEEQESDDDDEDESLPEPSAVAAAFIPMHERKPWFECAACENRTRDSAETNCCHKQICGTCAKKISSVSKCPFKCGGK